MAILYGSGRLCLCARLHFSAGVVWACGPTDRGRGKTFSRGSPAAGRGDDVRHGGRALKPRCRRPYTGVAVTTSNAKESGLRTRGHSKAGETGPTFGRIEGPEFPGGSFTWKNHPGRFKGRETGSGERAIRPELKGPSAWKTYVSLSGGPHVGLGSVKLPRKRGFYHQG